jgi:hypothetical protein
MRHTIRHTVEGLVAVTVLLLAIIANAISVSRTARTLPVVDRHMPLGFHIDDPRGWVLHLRSQGDDKGLVFLCR